MRSTNFTNNSINSFNTTGEDPFADLDWEQELFEERRNAHAKNKETVNLTSRIEDYIKSYL